MERVSAIKRSTPRIRTMPSTGIVFSDASVAASTMNALPTTPATFRRDETDEDDAQFLPEGEVSIGGMSDEEGGHREVNARAVHVERIARRQHKAHDGLRAAELFEPRHHARQHGFG